MIPSFVLLCAVWCAISLRETILYLGNVGWYFLLSPVVGRQTWQTNVGLAAAADAVQQALRHAGLPPRH